MERKPNQPTRHSDIQPDEPWLDIDAYPPKLQEEILELELGTLFDLAEREIELEKFKNVPFLEQTPANVREARMLYDSATAKQNKIEWLIKRHRRRKRIVRAAKSVAGLFRPKRQPPLH